MELERGVCVLCSAKTKVVIPSQAQDITSIISSVLLEKINIEEFEKVHSSLKVCPLCLQNLLTVKVLKEKFNKKLSIASSECCLCSDNNHLVILRDWQQLDRILENITGLKRGKCSLICLNCIKCLILLESIRDSLVHKYLLLSRKPESVRSKITPTKNRHYDHKRKVLSSSKCINDLETALKHLTPVKYSRFNCDGLDDMKLLKQVAYVKVYGMDDTRKDKSKGPSPEPSFRHSSQSNRNFFKIKMKPKSKKFSLGKRLLPKVDQKLLPNYKNLIVRIARMNVDNVSLIKTPTKASRKMMPDKETLSAKKRKSVTFADERNIEIEYGNYTPKKDLEENGDTTPLKPSLKKSGLNYEHQEESKLSDSDDDDEMCSYVEDIKKNIDNIFDSLKADLKTTMKGDNEDKTLQAIDSDDEVIENNGDKEEDEQDKIENRSESNLVTNKEKDVCEDHLPAKNSDIKKDTQSDEDVLLVGEESKNCQALDLIEESVSSRDCKSTGSEHKSPLTDSMEEDVEPERMETYKELGLVNNKNEVIKELKGDGITPDENLEQIDSSIPDEESQRNGNNDSNECCKRRLDSPNDSEKVEPSPKRTKLSDNDVKLIDFGVVDSISTEYEKEEKDRYSKEYLNISGVSLGGVDNEGDLRKSDA